MIGYYPVYLYSKKNHIIPEALDKRILPPLKLNNESSAKSYLRLMGSNMNFDSKHFFFRIGPIEILKDVPELKYSFIMTFDMLINELKNPNISDKRFNLMHFYLEGFDGSNNTNIISITIDLHVNNIQNDSQDPNAYLANLDFMIGYKNFSGNHSMYSAMSQISLEKNGDLSELISDYTKIYKTVKLDKMRFQGFLSSQIFIFKVSLFNIKDSHRFDKQ